MAFNSNNITSFVRMIQNYSRPFDEVVYTYDSIASNNDSVCTSSTSTKHRIT